jgi:hypothetical protein
MILNKERLSEISNLPLEHEFVFDLNMTRTLRYKYEEAKMLLLSFTDCKIMNTERTNVSHSQRYSYTDCLCSCSVALEQKN